MATKLCMMINYLDVLLPIKSQQPLCSHGLKRTRDNLNHYISTTTVPMPTKFDRMVTDLDGLLPIK